MLGHKFQTVTEMVGPSKVRNLWRSKHFENVPSKVVDRCVILFCAQTHQYTFFSNAIQNNPDSKLTSTTTNSHIGEMTIKL